MNAYPELRRAFIDRLLVEPQYSKERNLIRMIYTQLDMDLDENGLWPPCCEFKVCSFGYNKSVIRRVLIFFQDAGFILKWKPSLFSYTITVMAKRKTK